jgi:hypothetical protein
MKLLPTDKVLSRPYFTGKSIAKPNYNAEHANVI